MFSQRKQRLSEVIMIMVIGAIVSIVNTLWLRMSLLQEIERIAKTKEMNILRKSDKPLG